MTPDVIVIGGGPAGSSCAMQLARGGKRVQLYEKSVFPRPKLCGGVVQGLALEEWLSFGATPVRQFQMSCPSGAHTQHPLSSVGFSLSRKTLDARLLDKAREAGVEVLQGVDGLPHRHKAPWCVIATGRKPMLNAPAFYGFQTYVDSAFSLADQVALDLFPGGYVGWVQQEGRINLCGLVEQRLMRRLGPSLDHLLRGLASLNPQIQERLHKTKRQSDWLAVGPVSMGQRPFSEEQTLFIGDAAYVVDPFAGEGIASAIRSGHLAAQALLQTKESAALHYERAWHQTFPSSLRWQNRLRHFTRFRLGQEALVSIGQNAPRALEKMVSSLQLP